jgi:hypothetical protein
MDFEELDDSFLGFSLINDNNLFLSLVLTSLAGHLIPEQDGGGSLYKTSDDEDGLND